MQTTRPGAVSSNMRSLREFAIGMVCRVCGVWRPPAGALAGIALAAALGGCGADRLAEQREMRDARINVAPANYRAELPAALRAYLADPTNIRDAYVSEPELKTLAPQKRYVSCLRFNAKNSEGRYVGDRELLAVFVSGRFDQFIDVTAPSVAEPSSQLLMFRQWCAQADYKRFAELETLTR